MTATRATSSVALVVDAFQQDRTESEELLSTRMRTSPEGAFTILFTDIAGSTRLMEDLGERRWLEVIRSHGDVVRRVTDEHGGTVVKSQGDGFMLVFSSARAGLACAIDAQRAFAGDAPVGDGIALAVRIGLHSGFVLEEGSDFFGKSVVLAARLADLAAGREILVSEAVKRYTERDQSLAFEDRGETSFKGLSDPYRVYAVRWEGEYATPGIG